MHTFHLPLPRPAEEKKPIFFWFLFLNSFDLLCISRRAIIGAVSAPTSQMVARSECSLLLSTMKNPPSPAPNLIPSLGHKQSDRSLLSSLPCRPRRDLVVGFLPSSPPVSYGIVTHRVMWLLASPWVVLWCSVPLCVCVSVFL